MLHKKVNNETVQDDKRKLTDPIFGSRFSKQQLPKYVLPDEEISPRSAYQTITMNLC